jgi:uncharacterized membrane protein
VLGFEATVSGVNDRGQLTGYSTTGNAGSFVWTAGRVTWIPAPAGTTFLQMQAINDRGEVVGYGDGGAYLWRAGTLTPLPALVRTAASAWDVNDRGLVVGESATTPDGLNQRAVMWTR